MQFNTLKELCVGALTKAGQKEADVVKGIDEGLAHRAKIQEALMDTGTASGGAELIGTPVAPQLAQYLREYGGLMAALPPTNILPMEALRIDVPALESDRLLGKKPAGSSGLPDTNISTQTVRMEGTSLGDKVFLTRELAFFSPFNFYVYVENLYRRSIARTMEAVVINGDTVAGATNVNGALVAPYQYFANGLRKLALDSTATQYDAGVLSLDDFDAAAQLIDTTINPADLLFIGDNSIYWKVRGIVRNLQYKVSLQKVAANIWDMDGLTFVTCRDYPKLVTEVGRVDATPANNTKKSVVVIQKQALWVTEPANITFAMDETDASVIGISINFTFAYAFAQNKGDFKATVGSLVNITP